MFKSILDKIDNLKLLNPFSITIICILSLSGFGLQNKIDIQWNDTYFVITVGQISIILSFLLGIIWLVYWFLRNKRKETWSTPVHLIITLTSTILLVLVALVFKHFIQINPNYFTILNQIFVFLALVFLLAQLAFVFQIFTW